MQQKTKKPSLLILGAAGGVATAFLQIFQDHRDKFDNIVLSDITNRNLESKFIDHQKLNYIFLEKKFTSQNIAKFLKEVKEEYNVSIVLDITDQDTIPTLEASDQLGISYLNCSVNYDVPTMKTFLRDIMDFTEKYNNTTHVLSMGMNPGIADHVLKRGVLEYGLPKEFVEVEYETGQPKEAVEKPFVMWSKKQFLAEAVWDPSGYCDDYGKYFEENQPAIYNLTETRKYLEPIKTFSDYPLGMIVPHDEIISFAHMLQIPGRFVYALHPKSQDQLINLARQKGHSNVTEDDIIYADNIDIPLAGSDLITFWLLYEEKDVCYYVDVEHEKITGTNATLHMVAVGVLAGLMTFIEKPIIEKGTYLVGSLETDYFFDYIGKYIEVKKYVKNH